MGKINNRRRKRYALILLWIMVLEITTSSVGYALTSGPATPEVASFTPIDHTQMVDLFTGDFSYNIPLFELPGPNGGYPFNLAYSSGGVTMDTEASWVGLGWSLNPGAINRQMRGLPDDFKGDKVRKELDMKKNWTIGGGVSGDLEIVGAPILEYLKKIGAETKLGVDLYFNNYRGIGVSVEPELAFKKATDFGMAKINLGLKLDSQEGVGLSPSLALADYQETHDNVFKIGLNYNSKRGLSDLSLGYSVADDANQNNGLERIGGSFSFAHTAFVPSATLPWTSFGISFKFKSGGGIFGIFGNATLKGWYNEQKLSKKQKTKSYSAFGYNNSDDDGAGNESLYDINREKDGALRKESPNLGIPHYTADSYSIQGQGVGGMFRAFRNDVGVLHDPEMKTVSPSRSVGVDLSALPPGHFGANFSVNFTTARSGKWINRNNTKNTYDFQSADNGSLYESVYYKMVGEQVAEELTDIDDIGGTDPMRVKILNKPELARGKAFEEFQNIDNKTVSVSNKISKRKPRGQAILALTNEELLSGNNVVCKEFEYLDENWADDVHLYNNDLTNLTTNKGHHIGAFQVLTNQGMRYNYALPVYNRVHVEQQFSLAYNSNEDFKPILEKYNKLFPSDPNSQLPNHKAGGTEQYNSRTTISAYTTTHLLTNVLGHDYVDTDNNGPSDEDHGYWAEFRYKKVHDNYKWRAPYCGVNKNLGYFTNLRMDDDKASYMYGERENYLLDTAYTSTHYAVFYTSERDDARGAGDEYQIKPDPNSNAGKIYGDDSYKLDSIKLFSKNQSELPIKTVHFEYDYELCKKVWNNPNDEGKLSLKKVYFTYQNNCRGALSPYQFSYNDKNPDYDTHSMDRWGTYRTKYSDNRTNLFFPYSKQFDVNGNDQNALDEANENASTWLLNSISLPSGGTISVDYEADDYYKVQDRDITQMFKIRALKGNTALGESDTTNIISEASVSPFAPQYRRVYVELEKPLLLSTPQNEFKNLYLRDMNKDEEGRDQIYFKVLIDLGSNGKKKEFVTGYASINNSGFYESGNIPGKYDWGYIDLGFTKIGKNKKPYHPFFLAAAQKRRVDLPQLPIFGKSNQFDESSNNKGKIALLKKVVGQIGGILNVFGGYYFNAWIKQWGRELNLDYSWVKLNSPDYAKTGGGSRVTKVTMNDQWNAATKLPSSSNSLFQGGETSSEYGQEYDYYERDENGDIIRSYGVAINEPGIGGDESPLKAVKNYTDRIPLHSNNNLFFEYPINESHFPGASVGYEKVCVQTTAAKEGNSNTGYSIHEFFTACDFPVITEETDLHKAKHWPLILPIPTIGMITKKRMTATQGYSIQLNDMHGKSKKVSHYKSQKNCELEEDPISWIKYNYHSKQETVRDPRTRDNKDIQVLINEVDVLLDNVDPNDPTKAHTKKMRLGVDYDFFADMRENRSDAWQGGGGFNVDVFPIFFPFFTATFWPSASNSTTEVRVAATNKIIRRSGIMKSVEAFDQGSHIITENLAFDQYSGQALLTKVNNHFDDPTFSYSTPAYWSYDGMGAAYQTLGLEFTGSIGQSTLDDPDLYEVSPDFLSGEAFAALQKGAEFIVTNNYLNSQSSFKSKAWLLNACSGSDKLYIYSDENLDINSNAAFLLIRSGRRNHLNTTNAVYAGLHNPTTDRIVTSCDGTEDEYGENVIENNDFETGVPEFWSEYCFYPNECYVFEPGAYTITDNPNSVNSAWANCEDNTTGSGQMLVVDGIDGSLERDTIFARRGIPVTPGVDYNFGCSVARIGDALPVLELRYNFRGGPFSGGQFLRTTHHSVNISNQLCDWNFLELCDNNELSNDNDTLDLYIIHWADSPTNGNDFAIDDIFFHQVYPHTASSFPIQFNTFHIDSVLNTNAITFTDKRLPAKMEPDYCSVFKCNSSLPFFGSDFYSSDAYAKGEKGIWRQHKTYAYLDDRQQTANVPDLRRDGSFNDVPMFDFQHTDDFLICHPNWKLTNEITRYSPNSFVLEERDILNNYSAAQYGYGEYLPVAVGYNMESKEMFTLDFESDDVQNLFVNYNVSELNAHTGKKSLQPDDPSNWPKITLNSENLQLEEGKQYIFTCWVWHSDHNDIINYNYTGFNASPSVFIDYIGNPSPPNGLTIYTSGKKIEGFQRIEKAFTIPTGTTSLEISFQAWTFGFALKGTTLFDDVRIFPVDGNIQTYVYDPDTYRLRAVLDNNNYATIYRYNAAGDLYTVQKETIEGIKTLQAVDYHAPEK